MNGYKRPGQTARKRRAWCAGLWLTTGLLLLIVLLCAQWLSGVVQAWGGSAKISSPLPRDLAGYVNPFVGTQPAPQDLPLGDGFDNGDVFPGAVVPRGMVQWSPDTTTSAGGYRYVHSIINGFGLTHFSGRGCASYQDVPFLPHVGALPVDAPFQIVNYATPFSHAREEAAPGYYSVFLPREQVHVELTATPRTGFGRFTYPSTSQAWLFMNAGGSATGDGPATNIQIVGNNEVIGQASSGHFCGGGQNAYMLYFVVQFDQLFSSQGTWQGPVLQPGVSQSSGSQSGAYLRFDTTRNHIVQARVGLSFVSVNNALLNLQQESPGWDFDAVQAQARAAWNQKLGLIQVQGGSLDEKRAFYTALYHAFIHPNVFSDVNGEYLGFDNRVHQAAGYTQYENFPGWDMYRSLAPLLAMLEPRVMGDMLQSLLADASQGGGALPRWEVTNDNSCGMVGDSMDVVIATSYALGVRNFDARAALRAMERGASDPTARAGRCVPREGLQDYLSKGYVTTAQPGSAAITLEYALDDYAIGQFAGQLGEPSDEQYYLARAQNWRKLFDRQSGYLVPRNPDGTFLSNFVQQSNNGFVESSAATYTWLVPQDLVGLVSKMGGSQRAVARLDQFFQKLNDGSSSLYAFMGNEPGFGIPWIYDFAGRPDRVQQVIRNIQLQYYNGSPDGLPGNDDGGAMSSWYIFSVLGFYPEIPGVAGFALGSPLFPRVQLHLGNGSLLTINGQGASDSQPYVQSINVNQQAWSNPWLPWSEIQHGGTLSFVLGAQANNAWSTPIQVV